MEARPPKRIPALDLVVPLRTQRAPSVHASPLTLRELDGLVAIRHSKGVSDVYLERGSCLSWGKWLMLARQSRDVSEADHVDRSAMRPRIRKRSFREVFNAWRSGVSKLIQTRRNMRPMIQLLVVWLPNRRIQRHKEKSCRRLSF